MSKQPIRSLLYSGSTTKVYAHWMGWFGGTDHMNVGYRSDDAAQVHRQVADMMSRGIDGAIINWHGQNSSRINSASMMMKREAESQNGKFQFAIMEDVGSLSSAATTNHCDVTDQVINDLSYVASQFENSPAYLKMNGRPVVFFFGVDTYYIDWARVQSAAGNPLLLFRGKSGLTHASTDGAFQWEDHNSSDPFDEELAAQDQFYSAAVAAQNLTAFGSAYAGFNDTLAAWSTDRFTDQNCGQTWLGSLNEVGKFYSASNQLAAIQLVTWNDYEEGTALEAGVDNCVYVTPSVSGNTLNWTVGGGNENTIDHYTVFVSSDGQNLSNLGDVNAGKHSFDLSGAQLGSKNYTLYVKAVGRAGITNKMSPGVGFQTGDEPPMADLSLSQDGMLALQASTTGSSDSDGSVKSSSIDFGDGTTAIGPQATHTYSAPGSYDVIATVTDNAGVSAVAIKRVSVKAAADGVTTFSPSDGATINWPTTFTASANMANPVTSMKVLVDGQLVYAGSQDFINTPLKILRGEHHIVVQATDNSGATASAAIDVSAEPGDQTPVASIATFPMPGLGPNAVLACTAGSSDPDGFLLTRQVQFSDGTVSNNAAAVHTFASPGSYSATATVTDQYGATDSASESFSVGH